MKPSCAPSMGLPCASISSRWSMLSPARGGSGSSWRRISMSPACSASEVSFFFAHAPKRSSAASSLMTLFMTCLRCLSESEIRADRALQLGNTLLVHGLVHRQLQIVHAQLARAVEDHGEVHPSRRVAGLG